MLLFQSRNIGSEQCLKQLQNKDNIDEILGRITPAPFCCSSTVVSQKHPSYEKYVQMQ
jgi:hypothetical protein